MPYTTDTQKRNNAHQRLRTARGRAREYLCVIGEDHRAEEWAQIHDTEGEDPYDYQPLCKVHHREYDKPLRAHLKGQKRTEEQRIRMSEGRARAWAEAPEELRNRPRNAKGQFL